MMGEVTASFDIFWHKMSPVFKDVFLRSGSFKDLNYQGVFEGDVNSALQMFEKDEQNNFKEFLLNFKLSHLGGKRITGKEEEELLTRIGKISAIYGRDPFRRIEAVNSFKRPDQVVDWPTAKHTISEVAAEFSQTFVTWRPFDAFKKLFRSKAVFFRAELDREFSIVIGFEPRKLYIDEFTWIFHNEYWKTGVNFRTIFCLPLLDGTMTQDANIANWMRTYFDAMNIFVSEAKKALQD